MNTCFQMDGTVYALSYNVPEWMGFDWILSSQRDTAEDDEDEDEVGKIRMMDEAMAGYTQTSVGRQKYRKIILHMQ